MQPSRRGVSVVVLAAAVLASAACGSMSRSQGTPGRAIIIFEPTRKADAAEVRGAIERLGWTASATASGPGRRTRSSIAIYGQRKHPGRGTDLADATRPVTGEIEVLPFLTDGPGRHDAVVWLADAPER